MKRKNIIQLLSVATFLTLFACQQNESLVPIDKVSPEVISQLEKVGFNVTDQAPITFKNGYLVEGDIYISKSRLAELTSGNIVPTLEQYSTDNLVNASGGRTITVYIPAESTDGGGDTGGGGKGNGKGKNKTSINDARGGKPGGGGGGGATFSATYVAALDEAISRFNAENLLITFQRVETAGADIDFVRLGSFDESRGVLGSAGFPTSQGDPYGEIQMSGILESTYGLSVNGIATIMAHEMGHCIGFRHTDFFDRSISCGGSVVDEGDGGVGANHIPGTPTDATLQAQSWMLSCTDGSNRNFNQDDKTALDYLY